ncbi:hypothetical protein P170DRAFT_352882 [Aspergillus steynii IBT 23096]|uniref:BZIP domain-containing protein n=1 Tax=Aspergillus steynii IBT 23096 TaxID=1392250 RepID=A0A2I2GGH7_9EURO|nr:uncharacterized protein P170DRAFT_352882 [Aspergillus steynii IBT 23096]PLB51989.1 hypothetical protein P170DRAFT_352882 [Aspergillus steynii IBT 23096]
MSSQERIHRLDEDWTGVTDPALRKKLQNRVNQRVLRARKHGNRQKALILRSKNDKAGRRRYALILPRPDQTKGPQQLSLSQPASLLEAVAMMTRFNATAYERYYAADPCLDHLLTLTKFNVLRAFVDNMASLGLSIQEMGDDDISPFNTPNNHDDIIPTSLSPTATQRSIPHHPWLDCFPFPGMRDNLVHAAESFNDCELCTDIMDPSNGDVGMMVWGDPWLPQNWEVSELFVQKWSWVIEGFPEVLVHSNYWRDRRGLQKLKVRPR